MAAALSMLILDKGVYFITDPYVNHHLDAEEIAEMTILAARTSSAVWHNTKSGVTLSFEFRL